MGINNPDSGAGQRTLLHSETLALAGTFDVSGLVATHSYLEVVLSNARSAFVGAADGVYLLFNGDTTAGNYRYVRWLVNTDGGAKFEADEPKISTVPAASATATYIGNATIKILNYTSSDHKMTESTTVYRRSDGKETSLDLFGHAWESTDVVDQIQLHPDDGVSNFEADTKLEIWGIG